MAFVVLENRPAIMSTEAAGADASLLRNNSDTLMTRLNVQKNKSELFLIKSYSFVDKSTKGHALPSSTKLSSMRQIDALLLDAQSTQGLQSVTTCVEKSKVQKSKSTYGVAVENLSVLLRQPAIGEDDGTELPMRPKSMSEPAAGCRRKSADAVSSQPPNRPDNTAQPANKRESFLRHGLQTIRRSFSAHKKFAGLRRNAATCTASPTSTASTFSMSSKTSTSSSASSNSYATSIASATFANAEATNIVTPCNPGTTNHASEEKSGKAITLNGNIAYGVKEVGDNGVCNGEQSDRTNRWHVQDGAALSKSVSTLAATPNDSTSMAPLQSHTESQSVTTLNLHEKHATSDNSTAPQLQLEGQQHQRQQKQQQQQRQVLNTGSIQSDYNTTASSATSDSLSNHRVEARLLKRSSSSLNPLVTCESTSSIRSISPTPRKSASSSNWAGHTTAKHEQSTAAATAAAAAATTAAPAEKEKDKKRKEVSSSRVKKFHRHFAQVSKDEKLINYFSCALVSDILLQGHLYITDQHFAFYSNVFGYVTKVVIPTSSVTKISKEKTAKIIPNAVGVATADERHVFGSFISRESAFRLMCSVCPPLAPAEILLPKVPADIEISEEYSIEDDSSCSISGNESPPQALTAGKSACGLSDPNQTLIRRIVAGSSICIADDKVTANDNHRHSDIPVNAKQDGAFSNSGMRASAPPSARYNIGGGKTAVDADNLTAHDTPNTSASSSSGITTAGIALIVAGTASSTSESSSPTPSTSSSLPTTVMAKAPTSTAHEAIMSFKKLSQKALLRLKFPSQLHVVYLGVLLTMVLALFSIFLLYRILSIEAKTSAYRTPVELNWRSGNDDEIFAEALRWQRELQSKSTEEAQNILTQNLEQIAKVRRSLETLSMLIHDRSSSNGNRDDSD